MAPGAAPSGSPRLFSPGDVTIITTITTIIIIIIIITTIIATYHYHFGYYYHYVLLAWWNFSRASEASSLAAPRRPGL